MENTVILIFCMFLCKTYLNQVTLRWAQKDLTLRVGCKVKNETLSKKLLSSCCSGVVNIAENSSQRSEAQSASQSEGTRPFSSQKEVISAGVIIGKIWRKKGSLGINRSIQS
jgi:hypothetical protein